MNLTTQRSPDADHDWDAKATEALEAARLMPAGKEKSEALKRAGLLRKAASRRRGAAGRRSILNGVVERVRWELARLGHRKSELYTANAFRLINSIFGAK